MKTGLNQESRPGRGSSAIWAGLLLALSAAAPGWAQDQSPQLRRGVPNAFTPTTNAPWNRDAVSAVGGGALMATNWNAAAGSNFVVGYTRQNIIGFGIAPLTTQYGVGDLLLPPDGVGPNWVAVVMTNANSNPSAALWLNFANTNLLVAVDEGTAVVLWTTNAISTNGILQTYVIGPNLMRRPVRLFWTEGQYSGPRVRFGTSYEVKIYYNNQIRDPTTNAAYVTAIANENISAITEPTIFLKNNELRAMAGAKGRVLLSYSRRPEGVNTNRELLAYEVVDVLEPMSSTLSVHVADRLMPRRNDNPTNALFCDVTRGGLDTTGERPDEVFAYKHMLGKRNGWVWAIRPTDAPWQLEVFWKAKEQLDIIWPFEVDIYDVSWDLENSQRCALVRERGGTIWPGLFPAEFARSGDALPSG